MPQAAPSTARLLAACLLLTAAAATAEEPAITDASYVAGSGARVIRQSLVVEAPPAQVWQLYTTAEGLSSWAAPAARIDLRIGGSIQSSFKVGAEIGGAGTVTSEIVQLIPGHEMTLRDDLIHLLTMGGLYDWIDLFPQSFLDELESDGDDLYTTVRFEPESAQRTRVTLFSYGYRDGEQWDRVYEETKKSNRWFLGNLARRIAAGPIDWTEAG